MNIDKLHKLETTLLELLTKLNNGDEFSRDDIARDYQQVQPYLNVLDSISGFPFDMRNDDIYCFIKGTRKTFDKYHLKDIVKTILEYETNEEYESDIQCIIKESKLPRRDDEKYRIISSYESYELTHCISFEMAVRNKEVQDILEKIKELTIVSKDLYTDYSLYKEDAIMREESLEILNSLEIVVDIDFDNFNALYAYSEVMKAITQFTVLLEEEYYMIYDRKELIPDGMEDVFESPNHHEPDEELHNYMDKVIDQNLHATDKDSNYKDNYSKEAGYVVYQGSYNESVSYDINKIFPNFKRPMREFNQTQVAFNMSLPKDEIIAYINKIKDDYDHKHSSYKTLNQMLYGEDTRTDDSLDHKQKERYADDFFIYDYYVKSDKDHTEKLESIQKKLSQYHGMKVEKGRNNYKLIAYDEAQIKMKSPKMKSNSNSFSDLVKSFKEHENIIHYLALKVIEERYETIAAAICSKRYKNLIYDR